MDIKICNWIRLALVVNRFNTVVFLRHETSLSAATASSSCVDIIIIIIIIIIINYISLLVERNVILLCFVPINENKLPHMSGAR